ncbi:MAG: hypothetical protein ACRCTS_10235 [Fusobacteriaceae bacterium]
MNQIVDQCILISKNSPLTHSYTKVTAGSYIKTTELIKIIDNINAIMSCYSNCHANCHSDCYSNCNSSSGCGDSG